MDHRDRDRRHHHHRDHHRDYHRPLRYALPPPSHHRPQYIDDPPNPNPNPNLYIHRHQNPNFLSSLQTLSPPPSYHAHPVPLPPPPPPPPSHSQEFAFHRHNNLLMESPYRELHEPDAAPSGNWGHRFLSPNHGFDRHRHECDVYPRFRDDQVVEGLKYNHRDGLGVREDVGFNVFNSDGSGSKLRGLEYMDGLPRGREYSLSEEHRLVENRQVRRDFGDSFPGFREFGVTDDGEEFRVFAPVEQEAYYGSESRRFNSNDIGGRNSSHDYDLSPKNLGQKKSAFLRLQLPKRFYRSNGDDSRPHYESTGSYRGKWHFFSSDSTKKDKKDGNPVELDVSFKSNSLVAKPIVAPASASMKIGSDVDLAHRKLKSAVVSNKDKTESPLKSSVVSDKDYASLPLKATVISNKDDADFPLKSDIESNKAVTGLIPKSAAVAGKDNSSLQLKSAVISNKNCADSPSSNHKKIGLKSCRLTLCDNSASDPAKVLNNLEEAVIATENGNRASNVQKSSKEANTSARKRKLEINGKSSTSDKGCLHLESGKEAVSIEKGDKVCSKTTRDSNEDKKKVHGETIGLGEGKVCADLQSANEAVSVENVNDVRPTTARVCDEDRKKVQGKTSGSGEGKVCPDLQSGNEAISVEKVNDVCPKTAGVCDEDQKKAQGKINGLGEGKVCLDLQSGNDAVSIEKVNDVCFKNARVCDEDRRKIQGKTNGLGEGKVYLDLQSSNDAASTEKVNDVCPKNARVCNQDRKKIQGKSNDLGKCRVLDGQKVCSGKAYTLRDVRKKKVVKKVVKRSTNVVNTKTVKNNDILAKADCSSASSLTHSDSVKAGGTVASESEGAKQSRDIASSFRVEMSASVGQHSDRAQLELNHDIREGKSHSISLDKHGNEIDDNGSNSMDTKRENNDLSQQIGLPVRQAAKSDNLIHDDKMQQCVLVSIEDVTLSTTKANVMEETGPCKKLYVDGKHLSADNIGQCSIVQCSDFTGCLNSDKFIACKVLPGTNSTPRKGITSSVSGNNVISSLVKPLISESGCLGIDNKSSSNGFFASISDEVATDSRIALEAGLDKLYAGSKEDASFSGSGTDSDTCLVSSSMNVSSQPVVGASGGSSNDLFSTTEEKESTPKFPFEVKEHIFKVDLSTSRTSDASQEPVKISFQSSSQTLDSFLSSSEKVDDCLHSSSDRCGVSDGNKVMQQFSRATTASEIDVSEDGFSFPIAKRRKILPIEGYASPSTLSFSEETHSASRLTSSVSPLNSVDILSQPEVAVATPSPDFVHTTDLSESFRETSLLHNRSVPVKLPNAEGSGRDCTGHDGLRLPDPIVGIGSFTNDLGVPSAESQQLVNEQKENSSVVHNVCNSQYGLNSVVSREVNVGSCTPIEQVTREKEQDDFRSTNHLQICVSEMPRIETQDGHDLQLEDEPPSVSTSVSLSANAGGVSNYSTNNEHGKPLQDGPSNISFLHTSSPLKPVEVHTLDSEVKLDENSDVKVDKDDKGLAQNLMLEGIGMSKTASSSCDHEVDYRAGGTMDIDNPGTGQAQGFHGNNSILKPARAGSFGNSNSTNHVIQRTYPGNSSFPPMPSRTSSSSNIAPRPHTWHRAAPPSVSMLGNKPPSSILSVKRHFAGKIAKSPSTSYVRKGNSLVRKPGAAAASAQLPTGMSSNVYRLNPPGGDNLKRMTSSGELNNINDAPNPSQPGGLNASFERPKTPPFSSGSKLSKMPEHLPSVLIQTTSDSINPTKSNEVPRSSENSMMISQSGEAQSGAANCLENQSEGDFAASTSKTMETYQLAVTTDHSYPPIHGVGKCNNALSSDSYYKRKKNQLIRTSLDNQILRSALKPEEVAISGSQKYENAISRKIVCRRQCHKVKLYKPTKSSLVWTLHGTRSSRSNSGSLNRPMLFPQLFPWKRVTYWRNFLQNLAFSAENISLSAISRRLVLSRKRDTIYMRSAHGLSLRMAKVLGVGGSSLKWSKSIERRSKKANEEATRAVAAVEREKRQQGHASSPVAGSKNKNLSLRVRIFRIGCVRYKMDTSKRTLQRISDDESSCAASQSKKDAKMSYVPRRLVIGNDEYVRVGNGNQLVRNPKKRTRVLASEKVRWSLHTARLRLAKKRKYCQFFTRFGKCNKDDGKCPYIHDSSKIAVCTKFLNGLCSNKDCKLTHKVIPERMPDCSYFLQGLCANENCPYRHVNVNPNSPSCEGFLRGYCADGNECRKKHTYVCPAYEATGSCPHGSKCKLHHPKARMKGKKRKRSSERKNALGRYFGVREVSGAEKLLVEDIDNACLEGTFPDYISLNFGADEVCESHALMDNEVAFDDVEPSDARENGFDELINHLEF